ncbi:MAG: FIST N-terminal domain-containing protein [Rickettsiales bacterium]
MKSASISGKIHEIPRKLSVLMDIKPQLVLAFASPELMSGGELTGFVKEHLGDIPVIGCSTAGEISSEGVSTGTVSLIGMHFDHTHIKCATANLASTDASYKAGKEIAAQLMQQDLKAVFTLGPGVNVNGSEFVKGVAENVGSSVVVTGGLAGDGTNFKKTFTMLGGETFSDKAVAFGLYGKQVRVGSGSRGGWKPFGPSRRVTKSAANVLYELDGKPALALYKEYLGEKAAQLPSSGLLYPFAILREDRSTTGLIRTILDVDHDKESLVLAGDLPEGSIVCLMHADTDSLVEGSEDAANEAGQKDSDGVALLISCVGRRLVMGNDVDEEIEAVQKTMGKDTAIAGFYSYGEICPFTETGKPELHNQTMTITYITEQAA